MKLPPELCDRPTRTSRVLHAGCFVCNGRQPIWTHAGAQGTAARHHDATGHETWCDVILSVLYGRAAADDRQTDIEDAIASAGPGASSGGAPGCAALTDIDAPAVPAAGVSAPEGRPSTPALAAAKPETAHA